MKKKKAQRYKPFLFVFFLLATFIPQNMAGKVLLEDIRFTINLEQVSVRTFFDTLKSKTGMSFVYSNEIAELMGSVTVKAENTTIDEVLQKVLTPKNLSYSIAGKIVTIIKTKQKKESDIRIVRGRVTDSEGEPLVGVTINAPDIQKYALTDIDGNYQIKLPRDRSVKVTYSFVGMQALYKLFEKGNNTDIVFNVTLQSNTQLKDVVVTGIFTRSSNSFTGSAAIITEQELKKVGNQNVLQSLKNIDPTIYIPDNLLSGSDPNSLPDVSMRGTSSLPSEESSFRSQYSNQPNQPLFILDGFETSLTTIVDLDMNRIESVTILKDASAKALYGSKAANGVIVIETKKLSGNKQRVTYNGNLNLEIPDLTSYNLTNSLEKLEVELLDGAYSNPSSLLIEGELMRLYNQRKKKALEGLDTYWLSKPLRTGVGHKHNLSVELGDSKSLRTVVDFTYNLVGGAMKGSKRQTVSTSANISYRTSKVLFRNVLTYIDNQSADSPYGTFSKYALLNPYWEATDAQGNVLRWAEKDIPNPMYDATIGTLLTQKYSQFTDNLYAEWYTSQHLRAILRLGITHNKMGSDSFYPADHSMFATGSLNNLENRGRYTLGHGEKTYLSGDLNVRYSNTFDKHYFFVNAGTSISETSSESYRHTAEGFANNTAADITFARRYLRDAKPVGTTLRNREISFLIAASYDYEGRYLFDATMRESASSLYGSNNRWANSWSTGIGWNLHNESWLKNFNPLKQLKLRASVGLTGNQNFNTNAAIATYRYYSGIVYGGLSGAYLNNMPNPDLKWEQKMDYNFGLDTRIYGLNLSLDIYRTETKNMLTDLTIPTSTGFSIVKDNLGLVRNYGFEVKANYNILKNASGFLNLYGTISSNNNYIVRLSESLKKYNETIKENTKKNIASKPVILYQDGLSMNTIWAVPSAGIDPGFGDEIFIKQDGTYSYDYNPSDLRPLGNSSPKYRGNFGLNAEYKGIGLNITFTYLTGGQMYNSTLVDKVENADTKYNVDKRLAEGRWRHPGQITRFKKLGSYVKTRPSSRFIQDRNELHLSSVSLYYDMPAKWYKPLGIQRIKASLYMNDVVTFSSIRVERGTAYPFARKLSMSLNMIF